MTQSNWKLIYDISPYPDRTSIGKATILVRGPDERSARGSAVRTLLRHYEEEEFSFESAEGVDSDVIHLELP